MLKDAVEIPFSHHENWDGSGYPQGLKGESIPLAARIFAIVESYDALLSDKPYRKAWTKEKVVEYLKEEKGKKFDPKIIDTFLSTLI
jgi:HD-GYP domain-containing protein (c-di-GMP phosphodiesterase class II)